ncbi:MAG: FeoA family protein [Candidatus Hadarchaeales archaeon]
MIVLRRLLTELREGESGKVVQVYGGAGLQRRLAVLGIRAGKKVKVVTSQPFRGPMVLEVEGSQLAIGHGMAWKILVEVED